MFAPAILPHPSANSPPEMSDGWVAVRRPVPSEDADSRGLCSDDFVALFDTVRCVQDCDLDHCPA